MKTLIRTVGYVAHFSFFWLLNSFMYIYIFHDTNEVTMKSMLLALAITMIRGIVDIREDIQSIKEGK